MVYVLTPGCIDTLIMIGFNLFFQKRSDKENVSQEKSKKGGVKCIHPVFQIVQRREKDILPGVVLKMSWSSGLKVNCHQDGETLADRICRHQNIQS